MRSVQIVQNVQNVQKVLSVRSVQSVQSVQSVCRVVFPASGNLYTHMRKHTGQLYRCELCAFTTTNKGHLVEHTSTHSGERHTCELCVNDYNTPKSLQVGHGGSERVREGQEGQRLFICRDVHLMIQRYVYIGT